MSTLLTGTLDDTGLAREDNATGLVPLPLGVAQFVRVRVPFIAFHINVFSAETAADEI